MTPRARDHMPTMSLWGVAAKWPTRAPKTKLILCLRDPQGYSRISLPEHRVSFKANPMRYSMGFAKSHTEVLATQMGVMIREPVWPSSKAGKQKDLSSNLLRLSFVFKSCGLWTLSCDFVPHNYETLKWLSSLPILMQKSFRWGQPRSDRYIISLFPHPHTPFPNKPHGFCGR